MASIFTYQEEPPRVHSPWSTPGSNTPQRGGHPSQSAHASNGGQVTSITRLGPERHDGPTEYKLHLLLRSRKHKSANASHTSLLNIHPTGAPSGPATDVHGTNPSPLPANNSRQARLQQLTTQLLWRLQQSSPFHSSSNADLVLPILPEATPRLGVPDRPAKLLPGLEESQGALYEIGVADDGTLVGLVEEELEESLNNLRAMAASLGCIVDILRRVLIPHDERNVEYHGGTDMNLIKLWVAEVLVRPDIRSPRVLPFEAVDAALELPQNGKTRPNFPSTIRSDVQQIRIAVTGAAAAGKSSLVGTLTTSTLDNGRGKSRLSLLKHRHEISSGVTSSVAQELLGYRDSPVASSTIVNYATGDVSSWPDIHNLASRLIFLSDSPGLPRYAKSTFRTLVSWDPDWTLICVTADEDAAAGVSNRPNNRSTYVSADSIDLSLVHLDLCLRLGLPLVIVITKLDVATSSLRSVVAKILSTLKQASRTPVLLAPSATTSARDGAVDVLSQLTNINEKEQGEVAKLLERMRCGSDKDFVPIVLTSAVTGSGMGKLHALLRQLPPTTCYTSQELVQHSAESLFHVDEIFAIPPSKVYSENKEEHSADHGIVLCGRVAKGKLVVGDNLRLGPFPLDADSGSGDDGVQTPRSASYSTENGRRPLPRALSGFLSKSLQIEQRKLPSTPTEAGSTFLDVYIVSLRSLRLPVRSMSQGETGTVGVQPVAYPSHVPLSRSRKGMVLTSTLPDALYGYRSFCAVFPASDFINDTSPTLILGGHAIVYINSVRAAVKVTALVPGDANSDTEPLSPADEFFSFDGDDQESIVGNVGTKEARITFRFISTMEWMEVGNRVLVVPTVMAAGPVTGPSVVFNGLSGFVGRICDVFT